MMAQFAPSFNPKAIRASTFNQEPTLAGEERGTPPTHLVYIGIFGVVALVGMDVGPVALELSIQRRVKVGNSSLFPLRS